MNDNSVTADSPMASIIVPVFNVADYLEEGLRSILEQEFKGTYEVILVDDCSTDGCIEICRRYASDYSDKFSLVECAQNGGVSTARNLGLKQAQGRYLMFVDPDDILPPTALANLFEAAEHYRADIVKGNNTIFNHNSETPARYNVDKTGLITGANVLKTLYEHDRLRGHPWGKLFRRDRLGSFRFPVGVRMAQDLLYCSEVFANARSLLLLDKLVYRYRNHEGGSTGRKYEKGSYVDWIGAVEKTGKFASSARQKRAHKRLMLRTMTQIARECRKIPTTNAIQVLDFIEKKCSQWKLELIPLLTRDRLGLRDLSRYIKMRLAIREIRKNLSQI